MKLMTVNKITVKTKLTFLITGAGIVSSLVFSIFVFIELLEQPFDMVDSLLYEESEYICELLDQSLSSQDGVCNVSAFSSHAYWVEVYDEESDKLLFQSDMAKLISIKSISGENQTVTVPDVVYNGREFIKEPGSKTVFRVRRIRFPVKDKCYTVKIAHPITKLEKEIRELFIGVVSGFVISILVLIGVSRFFAGIILKPLANMNELAKKVCENNLDVRVPVGEGKDEFSEHADIINKMLDRVNNSFIRQRNFLFDTSHELKTPLASLRLTIDEINQIERQNLSPSLLTCVERMNIQILRMERLVKDLLKLASLETVPVCDFQPVDLSEILNALSDEYRVMIEAREIEFSSEMPGSMCVCGDEKLLRRTFSNILDNAINYNERGGRIRLRAEITGSEVTVSIGNSGQGVAAGELHSVFDQFYRGEKSRSVQYGGSGLGLSIVKRIVDIHGGNVRFESRENEWTSLTIVLPLNND